MNVNILTNSDQSDKQKKSQRDSVNREMKNLQLNSVQDKLLEISNSQLDKKLSKEHRYSRHTSTELKQEQQSIKKRTPSTEIWLKQHESQYQAWKERERERLLKKHKSLIKSYRIPTEDSCERELKLVRSKTFVARDVSPDDVRLRRRSTIKPISDVSLRNSLPLALRKTSRNHSVSISDLNSEVFL